VLQTIVNGVLVVGGVCLAALVGFELVNRLVPAQSRQQAQRHPMSFVLVSIHGVRGRGILRTSP
jgi:hypothetical protein